ncbi:MAG: methylenetetrahydrofolate--tRNA-(uracil(54)-C(5))-methyltransferase (FADH(2)-oxidizing) TrmFO [Acetobacteraceae bacterium]|nr:methylenetetrahydrofolate--tRNA-(uracil(54)-C(5))-methyltransferase (FADH(2)-oxidizing) TrmFO [Acetobacteraceae bacterium]
MTPAITIVGAGLAGSEASFQAARAGARVRLVEMRPAHMTEAHRTGQAAELVCSNSFRSDEMFASAVGLLHEEMRRAGSLILAAADAHRVPAGAALAVDREGFAAAVTAALDDAPNISRETALVQALPAAGETIIATGPLTAAPLAEAIRRLTGEDSLAFFDAIAPIVHRDSIDMSVAWMQSRWDKGAEVPGGGADYINCPLDRDQYHAFVAALLAGEKTEFRDFERATPYFDGCLPVEVMAERGPDTLRWGPMKPVGLRDPHQQCRPFAVVQLRQDNALGTLWNMVGFQTKLKHAEQVRVFRMIPGLERAEFARLGGLHRNAFLNSPRLLDASLRLKLAPNVRFAGQVTGVEGYLESAAIGLLAGRFAAGLDQPPPRETALGALLAHITGEANPETFQPMNVNFGLFPPLSGEVGRKDRKRLYAERALAALDRWLGRRQAA